MSVDDPEQDAIVGEVVAGKTVRDVARSRGMTVPEVNRVIDRAAAKAFSGEGMRRTLLIEAERLQVLKHQLWLRATGEEDLHAAVVYVKASERLASMLGTNHPIGHIITMTSTLEPTETATSTQRMLSAIRLLRGETAPSEDQDGEVDDGDR